MKSLKNTFAGAAGMMLLLGALAATPNTANAQSSRTNGEAERVSVSSATSLLKTSPLGTRLGRIPDAPESVTYVAVPDLGSCGILEVEEGHKAFSVLYAEGVQIYRWNGTSWTFVAPDAVLFPNENAEGAVGIHYAGPTWESLSGSKVVASVVDRCTPDPTAIPWLKLKAVYTEGPGMFERVTFIQRVNTVGGIAPAEPGTVVGQIARVPYTTDYVFYRAQD